MADISVCQTLLWHMLVGVGHCCGRYWCLLVTVVADISVLDAAVADGSG